MTQTRSLLFFGYLLVAGFAFAQRAPVPQQLTFTPYHPSGIYDVGETAGWTVTPGPVAPTYAYRWTIRRNNAVVLKEGKRDLSSGKDTIEIAGDRPEMIYVAVEPYADIAPAAATAIVRRAPDSDEDGDGIEVNRPLICRTFLNFSPSCFFRRRGPAFR
jgi:hypothetical protein